MPAPIETYMHRVAYASGTVSNTPPVTFSWPVGPDSSLPLAGELLLMVTLMANPVWTGQGSWTLRGTVTDENGTYQLWTTIATGSETGITFTAWDGIYPECSVAAVRQPRGANAAHSFTVLDGPNAADYTTPDVTPAASHTARMDFVTGSRAASDVPRPNPITGWYDFGGAGNTSNGPSSLGWWARFQADGLGSAWRNDTNVCRASLSWLIDLPATGWVHGAQGFG